MPAVFGVGAGRRFAQQRGPLPGVEPLATGVGEQAIEAAGQVTQLEAGRRRGSRSLPQVNLLQFGAQPIEFVADLHEGMRHRHQQGVDAGDRSTQPGFGR